MVMGQVVMEKTSTQFRVRGDARALRGRPAASVGLTGLRWDHAAEAGKQQEFSRGCCSSTITAAAERWLLLLLLLLLLTTTAATTAAAAAAAATGYYHMESGYLTSAVLLFIA